METSGVPVCDPTYIERKRDELKRFFADAKLPQHVSIDEVIENELKPLIEGKMGKDRPYIAASASGPVKSEYEVMTGQPFTQVEDYTEPLTAEKIKGLLKDNPILAEKAKQIQIVINSENCNKDIEVPFNQIKTSTYIDMKAELDSAEGDSDKLNRIKYKNMQILMNDAVDCKYKSKVGNPEPIPEEQESDESPDDEEFERIDKAVTKYTNKSYETRFQETKNMLQQMADDFEDPDSTRENKDKCSKMAIGEHPILKEASSCLVLPRRQTTFEEVKESYAINNDLNISLQNNPIQLNRNEQFEHKTVNSNHNTNLVVQKGFPKSFEVKLKDTEKVLQDIDSILSNDNDDNKVNHNDSTISDVFESADEDELSDDNIKNVKAVQQNNKINFDEKMETTLQNTLQTIFEAENNEEKVNNELEFKEMKALARNIVEGAESLKTFIKEDITNKLNSMNELLNDVNEALEKSRKSNIAYKKIKEQSDIYQQSFKDGEVKKRVKEIEDSHTDELHRTVGTNAHEKENVTLLEIDGTHDAITKLNDEIKCHENRINQSRSNYEVRNKECKDFIKEVDDVLMKSQKILHPKDVPIKIDSEPVATKAKGETGTVYSESLQEGDKKRKELWDIDISCNDDTSKKLTDFKQQEFERNKRIDNLLYDIKDKMKDNNEVLRLANNLLRREEKKKLSNSKIQDFIETDDKAKGDYVENIKIQDENKKSDQENKDKIQKEEAEKKKQREFQIKVEKELEEMNRGPRMTKEFIKNHCKQHKLYSTPYLNDILYLHFKGFSKIENLEEYTGLKCIFLENNGIQRIEGLDTLSELKCLYLHYNVVRKIENLNGCPKLDTLNLDHNFVTKIENLDVVPDLHTLSMGHNMLSSVDDLEQLRYCSNLSVVDLSYNRLEDPLIVDVLADMALLKVLVLTGNPVVRKIPAYRKTLTLRLKELLNLDNRPVFPRDRACAEAWQRGGVQEEIAERRRWIERDQEKVMQSVRYLIKMRDENRAKREAREQAEIEKLGLPPVVIKTEETETTETQEEKTAEADTVEIKQGVTEAMLSESEGADTTSGSSSDSDSDGQDDGTHMVDLFQEESSKAFSLILFLLSSIPVSGYEILSSYLFRQVFTIYLLIDGETSKIEWSKVNSGKRLVQEMKEEETYEETNQWSGFTSGSTGVSDTKVISELTAINDLLFNQAPHKNKKEIKETPQIKEEGNNNSSSDDTKSRDANVDSLTSHEAKRKPLIEIIEEYINKSPSHDHVAPDNKDNEINRGLTEDGNLIIDCNNKLAYEKERIDALKDTPQTIKFNNDCSNKRLIKRVTTKQRKLKDNDSTENNNTNSETSDKDKAKTEADEKEENKPSTSSQSIAQSSTSRGDGDGVALINYMARMKSAKIYDEDDPDLQPSAEDLEIFAELEKEELEKEARIARGEPAIDPMKLYDAKTMEAYYKAQEPEQAHSLKERNYVTTYKTDNAFDRAALSQLTAGEKPDEKKVKLTHVSGAVQLQYVNDQTPTEVNYEIGDENIEPAPSSPETDSVNISSDSDSSSSESELEAPKQSTRLTRARPATARAKDKTELKNKESSAGGYIEERKQINSTKSEGKINLSFNILDTRCELRFGQVIFKQSSLGTYNITTINEIGYSKCNFTLVKQKTVSSSNKETAANCASNVCCSSTQLMSAVDRSDVKQCIIDTINSYDDKRFPSQGINYSNMDENARVEDSVATEILNKTIQYEEQELYRQMDVVTSHASRVDNQTNSIIEQISDELEHECSLPEVSRILEAHVENVENRMRSKLYENYVPSPDDSDDNEPTLVPSHENSTLEDTFTEDCGVQRVIGASANDSGYCNDYIDIEKAVFDDDKLSKDINNVNKTSNDKNRNKNEDQTNDYKLKVSNDKSNLDNMTKHNESVKTETHADVLVEDEIFEDCVDDIGSEDTAIVKDETLNRVDENYTLEMKLALGMQ
ncbi:uncharacterized protein LOC112051960 [Bicyclus anynana]|uniref:Dynein axonemal assembly factor 1 homolog n=1 Tax=Bicyclus anynana TaxID=110368 RepID=A0ABM3M0I4_BICAN|nr:uncharacterized protein LOC112051960 [Bicyclus anynana]